MNRPTFLTVLTMLLAISAFAGPKPVPVHTFVCKDPQDQGTCPKGGVPSWIIQASDGNFYGVAQATTEIHSGAPEGGLVFSLTPAGHFTALYRFKPVKNFVTGNNPVMIVEGPDGMLYGETAIGGASDEGTLFRLKKDGSGFQVIHSFCSDNCTDGYDPEGLVAGNDGNVYGTTFYGGQGDCECGVIFQVNTATGKYKALQVTENDTSSMVTGPDGTLYGLTDGPGEPILFHYIEATNTLQETQLQFPSDLLVGLAMLPSIGANGNFYGIYESFQQGAGGPGLFETELDGSNLQAFPTFRNFSDDPLTSPLVLGSDGNFWLAIYQGADEIRNISATDGSIIQTLTPFSQKAAVGNYPVDLVSAKDGTLWGLTESGGKAPKGSYGQGVVFTLTPSSEQR
jgi:uncharacterized repeat protein (TIGR03803 family)